MKKVALISGSSSGIGKSIAHSLIEQNYIVFISGRNADTLANVSAQLGSNCFSYCGDLTHTKHINEFIQKVLYEQGQIDLCISNLGSGASTFSHPVPIDEYQRLFDLNFFSAVQLIQEASRYMKEKTQCIAIASITGHETIKGAPIPYSCAKSSLISFVKLFSHAVAKDGIRVNCISPGNVMFDGSTWDQKMKTDPKKVSTYIQSQVPLNTFIDPMEIGKTVLYLESCQSITGETIVVDAGQINTFR